MPGSPTPATDTDQQCEHCGLWFSIQGITNHEPNCQLEGIDAMVQPLEDTTPIDDHQGDTDVEDAPDAGATPEAVEIDEDPDPEPDPTPEQDGADPVETVTDGGNPALDAPDPVDVDHDRDDDQDDVDEDDHVDTCPHCEEEIENWDDLTPGKPYRCGSCGNGFKKVDA
jgi:hypothetical protein